LSHYPTQGPDMELNPDDIDSDKLSQVFTYSWSEDHTVHQVHVERSLGSSIRVTVELSRFTGMDRRNTENVPLSDLLEAVSSPELAKSVFIEFF
jgi:hypothetical protein